ncbi:MAG: M23 family metallopeptidase [Bacteroidota bacterium]|nr:M23 family metallopeptidase [Bacteroidota bacterium]
MILLRILLISALFINQIDLDPKDNKDNAVFISPVKMPLSLSASFGELRIDHFHSGLDIRTQGVTGKEVVATAAGYVYRISVSPGGFGKALYLRHTSGYETVYGHLDRFIPEIEDYVVSGQYENKSYMVTLWPPKDKFMFNQGDIIAFSGNTGSSSGPHLHYEIRKADEELPVNPLTFGFGVTDDYRPVIERLIIYPESNNTLINNHNKILKFNVSGNNGHYSLNPGAEITISGSAGFGLQAYDLVNNSNSKCSVYSIELRVDSLPVFSYLMDAFSFNESRYINSHIDYETYLKEDVYVERAFVLPNDKLSLYHNVKNRGIVSFNDDKRHHIEIITADVSNNKSILSFYARSTVPVKQAVGDKTNSNNSAIMPFNRTNRLVSGNVIVSIPSGALYDTLRFEFSRIPCKSNMCSDIYNIHNRYTPVHKPYTLSIKPDSIPSGKESKLLIIQLSEEMKKIPLPSWWANGYLNANPSVFGTFFVGIDTVPPQISLNGFAQGANMSGRTEIRIKINDDLSGIKSYDPQIDGKWALFEYDQKNNLLVYRFDEKRIMKGMKHDFVLHVTDNCGNVSKIDRQFIW